MNTETGRIASLASFSEAEKAKLIEVDPAKLPAKRRRELAAKGETYLPKWAKCPCGSGRRFSQCHFAGTTKRRVSHRQAKKLRMRLAGITK